jgi:FKBP-type peptidyl-prolyl cis-trans isomerase
LARLAPPDAGGGDVRHGADGKSTSIWTVNMMKFPTIALLLVIAAAPPLRAAAEDAKTLSAGAPAAIADPRDQTAYVIGYNLGSDLRRDAVSVDPRMIAEGIKDATAGATPRMTPDQMRDVLAQLQAAVKARREANAAKAALDNKTAGAAFLKANGARPGVVTLPRGLQYEILTAGSGPKPKADDVVECDYRGTLIDGTEFDSSYGRGKTASLPLQGMIRGWSEALQLMPVGSKWKLYIPPELAYGAEGRGPLIQPNATLIFEVELKDIDGKD